MDINVIVIGKIKEEYLRDQISIICKEINKNRKLQIIEFPDESIPKNAGENIFTKIKEKEGEKILSAIENTDYVVALCIEGKSTTSKQLKKVMKNQEALGKPRMVFVIGGSLGLSPKVTQRANYKMSFSKMTFPHQLMRVMLLEELYL